jgi:tetratricopeptide (TPR) repeat protein
VIGMKLYSICGEMLLKSNQFKIACMMYTKLLNVTYSVANQSYPEFKLYAYKQVAFCYIKMKEYDLALKTLKKQLQLAWVVNNIASENNTYENMAICYYYKGDLRRSSYYNNRYLRGVSEG